MSGVARRMALGGAAVLATGLLAVPSSAAPTWLGATTLSSPLVQGARVVMDAAGNSTAVWCRTPVDGEPTIYSSYRPAGGAWTPETWLGAGCSPELVTTPSGRVTAVWVDFLGFESLLRGSTQQAGGGWSSVGEIYGALHDAEAYALATDPAGDLALVFVDNTATGYVVRATDKPAGGTWSSPVELAAAAPTYANPAVVVDAAGTITAAWDDADHVFSSSRAAGGVWSTPADDIGPGTAPSLGVDNLRAVRVAWLGPGGLIAARQRPLGGAWSSVDILNSGGSATQGPSMAVSPFGAVVTWPDATGLPYAAHHAAGGGPWEPAVRLDDAVNGTQFPDAAADELGNFVVVWQNGNMVDGLIVRAARYSTGAWGPARIVSVPDMGYEPDVALNATGDGVVVYSGLPAGVPSVQAAGLDVGGPVIAKLHAPAKIPLDKQVTFSAVAIDTWSAVTKYFWSFGDGATKKSRKASHTYTKRGDYDVLLTVTDAVGNSTTVELGTRVYVPRPVIKVFELSDHSIGPGQTTRLKIKLNTRARVKVLLEGKAHGVVVLLRKKLPRGTSRITLGTHLGGKVLVPDIYVVKAKATNAKGTSKTKRVKLVVVR